MMRAPKLLLAVVGLVAVATSAAPGWSPYVVKAGDTLWALARAHHTTVAAIEAQNHLHGSTILIGQALQLPGSGPSAAAAKAAHKGHVATASVPRYYTVKQGDTLTAVAKSTHTTIATLATLNHLSGSLIIDIGQRLTLPAAPVKVTVYVSTPQTSAYAAAIAQSAKLLVGSAEPSHAAIQALVVATARKEGVDPTLAEAIANEESGFTERIVSPTDAVGVMQLEPTTAAWLANYSHTKINPYNLAQNIAGGVLLLKILSSEATETNAIAGYYQGLGSVHDVGLYPETKQYVAVVLALQAMYRR